MARGGANRARRGSSHWYKQAHRGRVQKRQRGGGRHQLPAYEDGDALKEELTADDVLQEYHDFPQNDLESRYPLPEHNIDRPRYERNEVMHGARDARRQPSPAPPFPVSAKRSGPRNLAELGQRHDDLHDYIAAMKKKVRKHAQWPEREAARITDELGGMTIGNVEEGDHGATKAGAEAVEKEQGNAGDAVAGDPSEEHADQSVW